MVHNLNKYLLPALLIFGVVGLAVYLTHVMANYYSADLRSERAKFEQEQKAFWSNVDHTYKAMKPHASQ